MVAGKTVTTHAGAFVAGALALAGGQALTGGKPDPAPTGNIATRPTTTMPVPVGGAQHDAIRGTLRFWNGQPVGPGFAVQYDFEMSDGSHWKIVGITGADGANTVYVPKGWQRYEAVGLGPLVVTPGKETLKVEREKQP